MELKQVALQFWGAAGLGDWNTAARLAGDSSLASRLRLDLGANADRWKLEDFTPIAGCYTGPDGNEAVFHYVFGFSSGKPWGVCRLWLKRNREGWKEISAYQARLPSVVLSHGGLSVIDSPSGRPTDWG